MKVDSCLFCDMKEGRLQQDSSVDRRMARGNKPFVRLHLSRP